MNISCQLLNFISRIGIMPPVKQPVKTPYGKVERRPADPLNYVKGRLTFLSIRAMIGGIIIASPVTDF